MNSQRTPKRRRRGSQPSSPEDLVHPPRHRTNSEPFSEDSVYGRADGADDTAIIYDPSEQRLYSGSKSKVSELAFIQIPVPRWSSSVDIYVNIGKTDTKAFVGRVNLKTLGWPITKMRLKGQIHRLYVLGKVRDGKVTDEGE